MNSDEKLKLSLETWVSIFNSCSNQKNREGRDIKSVSAHDTASEADKYYREAKERFGFLYSLEEVKNGCSG